MEDTPSHLCCRAETNSVADSVINDEVVFASGEIVDANFGVVTRFDVAALPEGPVWGGALTQPARNY